MEAGGGASSTKMRAHADATTEQKNLDFCDTANKLHHFMFMESVKLKDFINLELPHSLLEFVQIQDEVMATIIDEQNRLIQLITEEQGQLKDIGWARAGVFDEELVRMESLRARSEHLLERVKNISLQINQGNLREWMQRNRATDK